MVHTQINTNSTEPAKKKTSVIKIALIILCLLLALLALKVVLILTAKPKIKVDYVTEYNKITKPENYDPKHNAEFYYQKAFESFVEMPRELNTPYINWPTDYNDDDRIMLEQWLSSNSQAFEYFRIAANKPYWWLERNCAEKGRHLLNILMPESSPLRQLVKSCIWNARLNASKGRFKPAFEDILHCYRAGRQKCRVPSFMMEQLQGLGIKQAAIYNALVILDRTQLDSESLEFFQSALQAELNKNNYVPDFKAEKLAFYDAVQMLFVDNGRGTGRIAWRAVHGFEYLCGSLHNLEIRLYPFIGPTRNETIQQIEKYFEFFELLKTHTPWQLHNDMPNYFEEIKAFKNANFLIKILAISPRGVSHVFYETKAQTQALISILAILRFKADNKQFPLTLLQLVTSGYLRSVPTDPYSDGPLVYRNLSDDFTLYSVGRDFKDNSGVVDTHAFVGRTSFVPFSPPKSSDIVYWPVKRPEKPKLPTWEERMMLRQFSPHRFGPRYENGGKQK